MAEGADVTVPSQTHLPTFSESGEALQDLQPSPAPGASINSTVTVDQSEKHTSRLGIFKVLAGITPGTSQAFVRPAISESPNMGEISDVKAYQTDRANSIMGTTSQVSEISRDPRFNMAATTVSGISCDQRFNMAAPITTEISFDPRFNMAAPVASNNNTLLPLLMQQFTETREMCRQQNVALERLSRVVQDIQSTQSQQLNSGDRDSLCSETSRPASQYDLVSSEGELSDTDAEPMEKIRKVEDEKASSASRNLKKLKSVEQKLSQVATYDPAVHDVVASIVNKGLTDPVEHKSADVQELLNKHNRPENCTALEVPKVNKFLWSSRHTSKDLKQSDKGFQRTQNYLSKGMIPLIKILNKTLTMETEDAEELFDWTLDAFNLLAYTHRDLSNHRRRLLMPAISSRYAALCSDTERFSSPTHLFGDDKDLEKRLKEIDDGQKLTTSLTVSSSSRPKFQKKKWEPKDHKPTPSSSRDFLGRKALGYGKYQGHQSRRKMEQGQKKHQKIQKY